jgi:peptidoglycan/LPS O-acetylase OafA/YrhL
MADTRLAGADFVRATACLMVVAHHICQRLGAGALPPAGTNVVTAITMGAFGVGAFFVLSGYLLSRPFWLALDRGEPMPSLRTYAIRRAARILPGYWLALTVTFVLSFTLLRFPFDGELLFRYISGLALVADWHWLTWFPVEFNGPLWSICCEITSYALLPLCLMLLFLLPAGSARVWGGRVAWLAILAGVVGLQALLVTYGQPDSYHRDWNYGLVGGAKTWWPAYSPIGFYAVFAIGALAAGVQVRLARFRSAAFDAAAIAGFAIAIWSMWQNFPQAEGHGLASIPYGFPIFPLGIALILVATPSTMVVRRLTENPPIAFVARISFGIYVWHFLVMECLRVLVRPGLDYGMYSWTRWATLSGIMLAIVFTIATVSWYALEAPIIRWARRLEHQRIVDSPTLSPAAS